MDKKVTRVKGLDIMDHPPTTWWVLASDYDRLRALVLEARGALADIWKADDLDLDACKRKAGYHYRAIAAKDDALAGVADSASPEPGKQQP